MQHLLSQLCISGRITFIELLYFCIDACFATMQLLLVIIPSSGHTKTSYSDRRPWLKNVYIDLALLSAHDKTPSPHCPFRRHINSYHLFMARKIVNGQFSHLLFWATEAIFSPSRWRKLMKHKHIPAIFL